MQLIHSLIFVLGIAGGAESGNAYGQNPDEERDVQISCPDSLVKTGILTSPYKKKLSPDATYHWYYAGAVHQNRGGYSGKLLHGKYEVFDARMRLRRQGTMEYGLKHALWLSWNEDGSLLELYTYKHGKLHGKQQLFDNDTVIIKKYRHGKVIRKAPLCTKFLRKKPKKDKAVQENNP